LQSRVRTTAGWARYGIGVTGSSTPNQADHTTRGLRRALRVTQRGLPRLGRVDVKPMWAALLGTAVAGAAVIIKLVANLALGADSGFIVLVAAVVAATWVAGLTAGVATTVVTAILNTLVFVAPEIVDDRMTAFVVTPTDIGRIVLYGAVGVAIAFLISGLRSSRDELAESLERVARLASDIERRDERLELVLAASRTGFWEWDVRSGALVWSDTIFEQHGLDPNDGSPTYERYVETIHPDDRATFQRSIEDALASKESFSHEFRILWPDGSVHWTHGVGRVFRDAEGNPVRMVGTGQDITERRRLEDERDGLLAEERRAAGFREAFIDVISHELRTPITSILGLTKILARPGRLAPGSAEAGLIEDVADESDRLHRLVEDLLVLTRAERGQITVEAEPLELRRLLTRIVTHEAARLRTVTIDLDLAPDLPIVAGEATYVEQIIRNILGNAVKYGGPGTHVRVIAETRADVAAVRILDDGPGIDVEVQERAFELFYRDPQRAREVSGSGIGLFVCASLIRAMGGSIWATRRPEGGSEFGFTLKIVREDEVEPVADAPEAGDAVGATRTERPAGTD
jgi:PAS domain S-box-containing protein